MMTEFVVENTGKGYIFEDGDTQRDAGAGVNDVVHEYLDPRRTTSLLLVVEATRFNNSNLLSARPRFPAASVPREA
jgi:hypothetical protein